MIKVLTAFTVNELIFLKINSLAGQNIWLDRLAVFFADYAGYALMAVLLLGWFFKPEKISRKLVFAALISAVISRGIITSAIKFFYHHPRPFAVLADVKQLIPENNNSFPSGHAALYFTLSTAVYLYNKKLGAIFFAISLLMGFARIYAGVHWPADIIGGLIIGASTALAVDFFFKRWRGKLKI